MITMLTETVLVIQAHPINSGIKPGGRGMGWGCNTTHLRAEYKRLIQKFGVIVEREISS